MATQANLNTSPTTIGMRHRDEFLEFIEWTALPGSQRHPGTQKELAARFGVSEWTLSQWKLRDDFWPEVNKIRKEWGKSKTPEVLAGLLEKAKSGDAPAARLWLEYVENHTTRNKADLDVRQMPINVSISEAIAKKNIPSQLLE